MPKVNRKFRIRLRQMRELYRLILAFDFWPVESSSEAAGIAETLRIRVMVPRAGCGVHMVQKLDSAIFAVSKIIPQAGATSVRGVHYYATGRYLTE